MQLYRVCVVRANASDKTPARILEEGVDQRKERHHQRQDVDGVYLVSSVKGASEHIRLYIAGGKNSRQCVYSCIITYIHKKNSLLLKYVLAILSPLQLNTQNNIYMHRK